MSKELIFFCGCLLIMVVGCAKQKQLERCSEQQIITATTEKRPMITIFIHGSRIFHHLPPQEIFYSPPGMTKVSDLDPFYKIVHQMVSLLVAADPAKFSHDTFYVFGWSGRLDFQLRRSAAEELYYAILKILDDYEHEFGIRPGVRLITHSHGGNVALNLALVQDCKPLIIDELILFACPVQEATKDLINAPIFLKRYSLVSIMDLLQVIDPQGLYGDKTAPLFSERYFASDPGLIQVQCKKNGRPLFHLEFILSGFVHRLPSLLTLLDAWYEEMMDRINQRQAVVPSIDLRANSIKIERATINGQ